MKKLDDPIHINYFKILLLTLFSSSFSFGQETRTFNSLDEVLRFAKENNYTFLNAQKQTQLADLTYKTAIGNIFNPRIPTSVQMIDNFKQQETYLPGQIFGLPAGTYKAVTMGLQYTSTFNVQPQFDIINMANIAQMRSAKINKELVENQNKLSEQNIDNQINGIYFNILSFEGQKEILLENIAIGEKLVQITTNRFKEGVGRKQDMNDAEANLISVKDKLSQLEVSLQQQYISLNSYFENKLQGKLTQNIWDFEHDNNTLEAKGDLQAENARLQTEQLQQDVKVARYQNIPTLGFISSFNWQNAGNDGFFAKNNNWLSYSYWGLKLSWDFPTTVQKLSVTKSKQIQLEQQAITTEHTKLDTETKNKSMVLDYEKAVNQLENVEKIYQLRKDTYEKNHNQYLENILGLDRLLISQNDMLNSKLNIISTLANIGFYKNKILIQNKFNP